MGIGEIEIDKEIVSIFFFCFLVFVFLFGGAKSKQTARIERESLIE